ncbi:MAG: hypothetical protein JWO02_1633 [Solirubrobacterales bacterium]|nr:hypothetical protein [Solirubrobacterales bacterium]
MPVVDPRSPLTILGASGVALFLFLLLPWYGVDLGGELGAAAALANVDTTASAWQAFSYTDILLFLTAAAAIATFVLTGQHHEQAGNAAKAAAGLGVLCTLLVLYRIVNQPGPNDFISVKFGAFLGLIACAGVAYGAVQTMNAGPAPTAPTV